MVDGGLPAFSSELVLFFYFSLLFLPMNLTALPAVVQGCKDGPYEIRLAIRQTLRSLVATSMAILGAYFFRENFKEMYVEN